jgi:hypothetical protein
MSLVLPAGNDPLSVRPPEQRRFENALSKKAAETGALRRAITPWAGPFPDEVLEATIFHCGLYYRACLPETKSRRSRANLKRDIKKATRLTERLAAAVRAVSSSRDPTMRRWLDPVLHAYFQGRDGLPRNLLDPGLVHALDELWCRLALLDQALPDDVGGNRPALAFAELLNWLAGIYRSVAMAETVSTSTAGPFFPYVLTVLDLLKATAAQFPKAHFDFPSTDEALRKALTRTQPRR